MLSGLPADWVNWSVGSGLCVIFLRLISVRPARARQRRKYDWRMNGMMPRTEARAVAVKTGVR
jgi:hypothetical protein